MAGFEKKIKLNWINANWDTKEVLLSVDEIVVLDGTEKITAKNDIRVTLPAEECFAMLQNYAMEMIQTGIVQKFGADTNILGGE